MLTRNAAPASQGRLQSGRDVRLACRSGGLDGPTAGLAPGFVQGNLAILPRDWAGDRPQKRPIRGNLREDLGCAMIT